jgi:molybdenum cofactor cytidylyltransferase
MSSLNVPVSAIIPAAGISGRMGNYKALLEYSPGLSFTNHLVACYCNYGCYPVVLVINEQFNSTPVLAQNLVMVVNHHTEKGRSWSIRLGLNHVPEESACFIQNVDNPFLDPGLLNKLMEAIIPDGYAVPVCQGLGGHPILLGKNVVEYFRRQRDIADLRRIPSRFNRIEVPYPDNRIRWNINTPDDYKEFLEQVQK